MRHTASIAVALFCYGGNGGTSSLIPELALWFAKAYHRFKTDPRIDRVGVQIYSDTPIYMTRNKAVKDALADGFDFLLMLDSDNEPDAYYGYEKDAKLFLDEPFDFAYERLKQGIPTVIAAPYCGPPPPPVSKPGIIDNGEVPYLFQMTNKETIEGSRSFPTMLSRLEAARLKGIVPMWALPTGISLFSLNVFDGPPKPYFRYEHDEDWAEKRGTEDCFATRNLNLYWLAKQNTHVCYAACDSWAWHHKPKKVGKPDFVSMEEYAKEMRDAIVEARSSAIEHRHVDYTANLPQDTSRLPRRGQVLGPDDDFIVLSDEDMRIAQALVEMEKSNGHKHEISAEELRQVSDAVEEASEEDTDIDDTDIIEEPVASYDGPAKSEPTLNYTTIQGKKVAIFDGFEVAPENLEGVEALTSWLATRRGGALEVAVVHSGTGQSAAVINSALPDGSHIYALDCFTPHKFSTIPAENFNQTFALEIASGRVQVDNLQRKMPHPETQQHLDFVFIEQFITPEKLEKWLPHIQGGGLLAGLGYEGKSRLIVKKFADANDLPLQTSGDVWALRIKLRPVVKPVVDEDDERVDLSQLAELTDE